MPLSMYEISVSSSLRALDNLRNVLKKGEAHATEKGFAPEVLLHTRLTPDMLPLLKQVQIATDMAKNAAARLTGTDLLAIADDETTFEQLYARIERVTGYLQGFEAAQFDGSETREVTIKNRNGEMHFSGREYLLFFVLPNVYFHCTTAYAILRQSGVPLGKMDFMGAPR